MPNHEVLRAVWSKVEECTNIGFEVNVKKQSVTFLKIFKYNKNIIFLKAGHHDLPIKSLQILTLVSREHKKKI